MAAEQLEAWDIVSGVGLTALIVAAGRAIDSNRADALIDDPLAAHFLEAADAPVPMPTDLGTAERDGAESLAIWTHMSNHLGVRTRFFDDCFLRARAEGAEQAVVVASGLDTRAFRLDLPAGFGFFEIDQPKVLAFKEEVLRGNGAAPRCDWRAVATDLRTSWSGELVRSGFDPAKPTVWVVEGLLMYLTEDAEKQLLDVIRELSAPGSRLVCEHLRDIPSLARDPEFARVPAYFHVELPELLLGESERPRPEDRIAAWGWEVSTRTSAEMAGRYRRKFDPISQALCSRTHFITARSS
ncbi:SAM-dependent methyltransferase [Saccharopolyspora taberi]|uniref:S-adenosyl-L-methionine-dependent methyltransferase n=1 Tax=Saccharopolyspora taberi TaxID=60895 RepID=A0ABN3V444_9PSEU